MNHWPYPFWFAHRGAGTHAPENTLAAFRLGMAQGFNGFECDVKVSAEGVPYLLHDNDLDRTTSAKGPAQHWLWSDLSRLDAGVWHSKSYAGEPPASLDAVMNFCVGNHCAVNLEIKPCPGQAYSTGKQIAHWLAHRWPGNLCPPLISSFEPQALQGFMDFGAAWPRALLLDETSHQSVACALSLGCSALVVNHVSLVAEQINYAKSHGLRVLAFTVNSIDVVERLQGCGIDGLISDEIFKFAPLIQR